MTTVNSTNSNPNQIDKDTFLKNLKSAEEQIKSMKELKIALEKNPYKNPKQEKDNPNPPTKPPKKSGDLSSEPASEPEESNNRFNNQFNNQFYTGQKSKKLLVHVMQNNVEVTKPIKKKIYEQKVNWNKRDYPIIPTKFVYDHKGIAHQYVETNDVSVLSFNKDHEDKCRKCGGKMTIDARSARELGRRGIFHAIWALDSTHMIMMIVIVIAAIAGAGFGVYFYGEDMKHKTGLENLTVQNAELKSQIQQLINPIPITQITPIDPNAPTIPTIRK